MRTTAFALPSPRGVWPPRRSFRRILRHRRRHRCRLCRRRGRGRRRLLRRAALRHLLIRGHAAWVRDGRRRLRTRGGHLVLRLPKARTILRCRLPSLARGCRPGRWWWRQLRQYRGAHARQKRYHIVATADLALLLADVIVLGVRLDRGLRTVAQDLRTD